MKPALLKPALLPLSLIGLLMLSGAVIAQESDPASPKTGNVQRGRALLSILGPKPQDASGISPLQQQELNRRVRCAAIREQIQDQLDFEAAGSVGFYAMAQLRAVEGETCAPVQQDPLVIQAPKQPVATYRPPVQRPSTPPPQPQPVQQPLVRQSPPQPSQVQPALPQQPLPQPPRVQQPPPQQSVPQQPVPQSPVVQPASAQRQAQQQPLPPSPPPAPTKPSTSAPDYTPAPDYPHDEMAAGHEGVVVVQLVMNADGSVKSASVSKSCNYPILDAAALTAAKTWRIPAAAGRTIVVPLKFSAH